MPRKRQPGDIRTTIMLPGDLHRTVKAACALEGITVNKKLHDLLTREYPEFHGAYEPAKRKRRQPSKVATMQVAE